MCWNKGRLCWKIAKLFYFCHLKKLVRPETFGPYYVYYVFSRIFSTLWGGDVAPLVLNVGDRWRWEDKLLAPATLPSGNLSLIVVSLLLITRLSPTASNCFDEWRTKRRQSNCSAQKHRLQPLIMIRLFSGQWHALTHPCPESGSPLSRHLDIYKKKNTVTV